MVGINKKPDMSEFEKGVVHGRSLAEAEDADQKCMTSLTDKMEELRRDTPNEFDLGSERSTPKIIRDNGFNQGVDASIALAEAEEAVVGDWEAGFRDLYEELDYPVCCSERDCACNKQSVLENIGIFITTLLAAKDRDIVEAYAQGWNEGQIDLSARLKP